MPSYRKLAGLTACAVLFSASAAPIRATGKKWLTPHEFIVSSDARVRSTLEIGNASKPEGKAAIILLARAFLLEQEVWLGKEIRNGTRQASDDGVATAQSRIAVADKERSIGCPVAAKKELMNLIDTYTGTAYASPRQHAQIEIEDMRASPQAPDPAYCAKLDNPD